MRSVSSSAIMRQLMALAAPAAMALAGFAASANAASSATNMQASSVHVVASQPALPTDKADVANAPVPGMPVPGIMRLAQDSYRTDDSYRPPSNGYDSGGDAYRPPSTYSGSGDAYRPPSGSSGYGSGSAYNNGPPVNDGSRDAYRSRTAPPSGQYGDPYVAPPADTARSYESEPSYDRRDSAGYDEDKHYSQNEIVAAGHGFFGSISKGLASVIEYAFKKAGRPNGYILGEDASGAFVAGLRYGEGRLYTKDAGTHKVYWQGPSVGYDFGGAGAKTMVLVYNLRDPSEIYHRFGGVEGSAYLVGGVSIQFQKYGDVVMAPIRAGVGLRIGANVGYLKYTRRPTWNPF